MSNGSGLRGELKTFCQLSAPPTLSFGLALCAMLSDCEDFTEMGHFASSQLHWLRQFIPLKNGPPSHDVFRNVFLALQPELLLEILELWVGELDGKQIAIDGKVSRGAKDSTTGRSTLHILRARVSEASLSVGHEVCAEKSNELEALPRLLAKLQLHGATVTIDAMGVHPEIAKRAARDDEATPQRGATHRRNAPLPQQLKSQRR